MIRPVLVLSVFLLAALGGSAVAATTEGPHLATVEMIETKGSQREEGAGAPIMSLATIDPLGRGQRLVGAKLEASGRVVPSPFFAPAWSHDGSRIAFSAHTGEGSRNEERIFAVSPDGGGLRPVPGTRNGTNPVFSPDGHTLAFARSHFHIDVKHITEPGKDRSSSYVSTTTWVVDLPGGEPRRLTRWRNGLSNVPGSFTPDGSDLLLTKNDDNLDGPRIVRMTADGGGAWEIIVPAEEPAVSPDGSRIAFVGYLHPDRVEAEENHDYSAGELYVARADGSGVKRLTRTDDVLESSPSWDPSGQRIAYVQVRADTSFVPGLALFPTGNALMQMNADGSCPEKILSQKEVAFYGVAWQPGLGREVGPIACPAIANP